MRGKYREYLEYHTSSGNPHRTVADTINFLACSNDTHDLIDSGSIVQDPSECLSSIADRL